MCASYGCLLRDGDLLPAAALRRFEDRVGDGVGREPVAEGRRRALAARRRLQEVGELVDERVLVADLQTRHPPVLHVRMIAVRDVDAAPAAQRSFVAVIEPLQTMEVVEIPARRRVLAVDLAR